MPEKQRPCPCAGAGCCGTRAIWLKLYCLNLNLQQVSLVARREMRMEPVPALFPDDHVPGTPPGPGAMPSEGIEGDEWGT